MSLTRLVDVKASGKESRKMSEARDAAKEKANLVNVLLKSSEPSSHPLATNYTNVGVAQGVAYVDFGFIEPALLAAIAKTAKDGQPAPKGLEGHLVTRVAMGVDVLARLHQQIREVLINMRDMRLVKGKGEARKTSE